MDLRKIVLNAEVTDEEFVFKRPADKEIQEIDLTSQVIDTIRAISRKPMPIGRASWPDRSLSREVPWNARY